MPFNQDLLKKMEQLSKTAFVPSPQMAEKIQQMKEAEQMQVQQAGGSGVEGQAQPQVSDPNNPTTITVDELAQMVGESNEMMMGAIQQLLQMVQQISQSLQMQQQQGGAGGKGGKGGGKPDVNALAQQVQQLTDMVNQLTGGMAGGGMASAPAGAPMDPAAAQGGMPPADPAAMGGAPPPADPMAAGMGAPPQPPA